MIILVWSIRLSPDTSEIQTAADASANTASPVSEAVSEVISASDQSQPVRHGRSPVPSESVSTAVDSSAAHSSVSSVHTNPSLQQSSVQSPQPAGDSDQGLGFYVYDDVL